MKMSSLTKQSINRLHIDIETYSETDLVTSGVYRYAEDPTFEILLIAYSFNEDRTKVIDIAQGEELPKELIDALTNKEIRKIAHNANFERVCLAAWLGTLMPYEQWECTAALASRMGLPRSLEQITSALNFKSDQAKMKSGKVLIQYFCKPCTPTARNGQRTRNLPQHDPDKWQLFKNYCAQDVKAEMSIYYLIYKYPQSLLEQIVWQMDQKINDYGVRIDTELVASILLYYSDHQKDLIERSKMLTGLDNPNSISQMKKWLYEEHNIEVESLNKDSIEDLVKDTQNEKLQEVLNIRQELSKTSVAKYSAMERTVCEDECIHGMLVYHGASTGRWTGKFVQPQNLPRNKMPTLNLARELLKESDYEMFDMLYDQQVEVFSQLIRTAFIPKEDMQFVIADFSAIEARILSWLADEKWRMEVFAGSGKIYEEAASKIYDVPIEQITKDSPMRAKGKVAELALGYQGGPNAIKRMGGVALGLNEVEMKALVQKWRMSNPRIVALWQDVEDCVKRCITTQQRISGPKEITYFMYGEALCISLPSGRVLYYRQASINTTPRKEEITYMGINSLTQKWSTITTYGGCLVENIVQAIARDCLVEAMARIMQASLKIVFHVHDEIVVESKEAKEAKELMLKAMACPIKWAPGLILKADAFISDFYKKD